MTVLGTGFMNAGGISCRFIDDVITGENRQVHAVWKSGTWIMCVAPLVKLNLLVTVEVSNNFQDFTVDGLTYTFEPAAVLLELQPSIGPIQGKHSITVYGMHFNNAPLFTCKFEHLLMPAVVKNSNEAICGVPPSSKAACISLSASNNGVDFTNNGLKYCYIGALEAISMQPSFGPQTGNTLITLIGSGFTNAITDQATRFFCSFQDAHGHTIKSVGRVLSHSMLSCYTPAQSRACLAQVGAEVDQVSVTAFLHFHNYQEVV